MTETEQQNLKHKYVHLLYLAWVEHNRTMWNSNNPVDSLRYEIERKSELHTYELLWDSVIQYKVWNYDRD